MTCRIYCELTILWLKSCFIAKNSRNASSIASWRSILPRTTTTLVCLRCVIKFSSLKPVPISLRASTVKHWMLWHLCWRSPLMRSASKGRSMFTSCWRFVNFTSKISRIVNTTTLGFKELFVSRIILRPSKSMKVSVTTTTCSRTTRSRVQRPPVLAMSTSLKFLDKSWWFATKLPQLIRIRMRPKKIPSWDNTSSKFAPSST